MPRNFVSALALFVLLAALCACSGSPKLDKPLDFVASSQPKLAFSPAPQQQMIAPSPTFTSLPSLSPKATLKLTMTPMVSQHPQNTPDDGRVTLAEGFYYVKLDDAMKKRITGMSYPEDDDNSAITYDDLRYIQLKYYDFEGNVQDGELIVHKRLAQEVTEMFHALYKKKYPFTSIRLVDDFGEPGDDTRSMEANNTSAFNYRRVTGSKTLSRHSYGAAIDVNPKYNPYIDGDRIAPENGKKYADRSLDFPGKIDHSDDCYKLFAEYGWSWGGDWSGDKDYQHFSKDIGY